MTFPYSQVKYNGTTTITVILPDGPKVIQDDHPNFEQVRCFLNDGEAVEASEVEALVDIPAAVAAEFQDLTDRVSVRDGRVYYDEVEVDSSIARLIVRALEQGTDFLPLVRFLENLEENPSEHSREQLFDWLRAHEFTINREGMIVGYKGVRANEDGDLESINSGTAYVQRPGESGSAPVEGQIPYPVGATVSMPRDEVVEDPGASCSRGLHVGTFDYAQTYAQGAMLKVLVNPRDVVSVPTDAGGEKVRVCRLQVVEVIDAPETVAVDLGDLPEVYPADPEADREFEERVSQALAVVYGSHLYGSRSEEEALGVAADCMMCAEDYAVLVEAGVVPSDEDDAEFEVAVMEAYPRVCSYGRRTLACPACVPADIALLQEAGLAPAE